MTQTKENQEGVIVVSLVVILFVICTIFLLAGLIKGPVRKIELTIDENETISNLTYEYFGEASNFDRWFISYNKGEYGITVTSCDNNSRVIKTLPNIGQSNIILYLGPPAHYKPCVHIILEKYGVVIDTKTLDISEPAG